MSDEKPERVLLKIIIGGDGAVGKTSLARVFNKRDFNYDEKKTVGLEYATKKVAPLRHLVPPGQAMMGGSDLTTQELVKIYGVNVPKNVNLENCEVTVNMWDLAGQISYEKLQDGFYRGVTASVLIFDFTSPQTLDHIFDDWKDYDHSGNEITCKAWAKRLQEYAGKNWPHPVVLVGNKFDILYDSYKSTREEARMIDIMKEVLVDYSDLIGGMAKKCEEYKIGAAFIASASHDLSYQVYSSTDPSFFNFIKLLKQYKDVDTSGNGNGSLVKEFREINPNYGCISDIFYSLISSAFTGGVFMTSSIPNLIRFEK